MSETLVKVENVSKKFCKDLKTGLWYGVKDLFGEMAGRNGKGHAALRNKEFWAVKDVSFELKRGECLGLIGHNGAGKSTLLKMLNGLIKPDTGRIEMRGRVGALIELGAGFNPILTGRENIYVNGSVLGFSKQEIDKKLDLIIEFADIREFIDTPVQYYSSGMKVRLGFAVAAQMEPDILIIDEVLAVGDASFRVKCHNKIFELLQNCAVIFVSHYTSQISRICTSVKYLEKGRVGYSGNDVPLGIKHYYQSLQLKASSGSRYSKDAAITRVYYENSLGKEVQEIEYLESLVISISYVLKTKFNEGVGFLMCFKNEEQINVAQLSSELDEATIPGQTCDVEQSLKIDLGRIILNPGKYTLDINLIRARTKEITYVLRDAAELTVTGKSVGYAPVLLNASWNLKPH